MTDEPTAQDFAFSDTLERLARYNSRNNKMLRRMRNLYFAFALTAALSGGSIVLGAISNGNRITDIQRTREAAIIYACRQQNQAHIKTLIFLDRTELKQLHKRVGPQRYPAIERHTLHVLHDLPRTKRRAALSNHRLLLAFIDNLAPYHRCLERARALSSGQTHPH